MEDKVKKNSSDLYLTTISWLFDIFTYSKTVSLSLDYLRSSKVSFKHSFVKTTSDPTYHMIHLMASKYNNMFKAEIDKVL